MGKSRVLSLDSGYMGELSALSIGAITPASVLVRFRVAEMYYHKMVWKLVWMKLTFYRSFPDALTTVSSLSRFASKRQTASGLHVELLTARE